MLPVMKNAIEKVFKMSKTERLMTLCTLAAKEMAGTSTTQDQFEMCAIQSIRHANGELEEVKKQQEEMDKLRDD